MLSKKLATAPIRVPGLCQHRFRHLNDVVAAQHRFQPLAIYWTTEMSMHKVQIEYRIR